MVSNTRHSNRAPLLYFLTFLSGFFIAWLTDQPIYKEVTPTKSIEKRWEENGAASKPAELSANRTANLALSTTVTNETQLTSPAPETEINTTAKDAVQFETVPDELPSWPTIPPEELFGDEFNRYQVIFRDPTMATCHLGAFGGNFGDMIGPDVVKRILEYHFGYSAKNLPVVDFEVETDTPGPCLFTVGSIWRRVRPNDHVWGAGSHGKWLLEFKSGPCKRRSYGRPNNVTVYSIRGPHTASVIKDVCKKHVHGFVNDVYTQNISEVPVAGDPGFLIPFLFPEIGPTPSSQTLKPCVVLHKYDEETFENPEYAVNSTLLPVIQPWQTMVGNISRCSVVSSSSLHGLVIADAYGIPARWIQRSKHILPFKFEDYFDSLGFKKTTRYSLFDVLTNRSLPLPATLDPTARSTYAERILASFPFHLFTTTKDQLKQHKKDPPSLPKHEVEPKMNVWPSKPPQELFGDQFHKCRVVFRDPTMATCHLGAFGGNFGDMIGPDVVKRLTEYRFGCSAEQLPIHDFAKESTFEGPCLFSVGSVWRTVRANDHVWGSGSLGRVNEFQIYACKGFRYRFNNVSVYSVRGPRSHDLLLSTCNYRMQALVNNKFTKNLTRIPEYGDGGFLVPYLFPEIRHDPSKPTHKSCVILHKYDEETFNSSQFEVGQSTFLPVVQSWQTMVGNLTQCDVVSSSSLHGIILSDAFGIPARWVQREASIHPFKFHDYHESVGHSRQPCIIEDIFSGREDIPKPIEVNHRSDYAERIVEAFPFHLFRSEEAA